MSTGKLNPAENLFAELPTEPAAGDDPHRSPAAARRRLDRLLARRDDRVADSQKLSAQFAEMNQYLGIADGVTQALEQLNEKLFEQVLNIVREKLTVALQEILEQPIQLRAEAAFKNHAAVVEFGIERDGNNEDVLRGQGGSVANILSVGLRIFALAQLDEKQHRRFLVLDEQDCWLRPDLVPKLVKIVADAGRELGFQTLLISHHDVESIAPYADKIYVFQPTPDGVEVVERKTRPLTEDPD